MCYLTVHFSVHFFSPVLTYTKVKKHIQTQNSFAILSRFVAWHKIMLKYN